MTILRHSTRAFRLCSRRANFSTATASTSSSRIPWFIDTEPSASPVTDDVGASQMRIKKSMPPVPPGLPDHLLLLHDELSRLPQLEPSALEIRPPFPTSPGPPLPPSMPKGRRKRGRTELGEGVPESAGGLWRWIVLAQVKEGTEARGSIASAMRVVRKSLLGVHPPLQLPPNSKKETGDGWAMIDAGDFAVHIVSRTAREKFFPVGSVRDWEY